MRNYRSVFKLPLVLVFFTSLLGASSVVVADEKSDQDAVLAYQAIWENAAKQFAAMPNPKLGESVDAFLRAAYKTLPDQGASVRRILSESQYYVFRGEARGAEARMQLFKTPISMQFTSVEGMDVNLEKMRGKVVLLDFRGILHCEACESDEPRLKEAYEKYHAAGFEIVSISDDEAGGDEAHSYDKQKQRIKDYVARHGLLWPTYFDGLSYNGYMQDQVDGTKPTNPWFRRFNVGATPTYFLIRRDGTLSSATRPMDGPAGISHLLINVPGFLDSVIKSELEAK